MTETPAWVVTPVEEKLDVDWHARVRWAERVRPSADPGREIAAAFVDAAYVESGTTCGLWHPPTETFSVVDGEIVTVWPATRGEVEVIDGDTCDTCGDPHHPRVDRCPWCNTIRDSVHRLR